jgi:chromosome segregation ATPase
MKRLRMFQGTLEQLQALPVPLPETIDRFENELADAQRAVQRIDEQLAEWTGQRETTDRELEKLRLEHDVPTERDLVQARQRRDEGWQLVRETLRDGQPADLRAAEAFVALMAAGGDLAAAFQASQERPTRSPTGCAARPARWRRKPC